MKLAAPRDSFLSRLQLAASVCPTRSPKPILQDVLISVPSDGVVEIVGTDREISVRTRLEDAAVSGEGQTALPAQPLLAALKELPAEMVEIEESSSQHVVTGGSAVFKLFGDDPTQFPSIPTVDVSQAARVPLHAFVEMCNRTMFAAAREMGRYAFNGVLLELAPESLTLVATDGRRLATSSMNVATGVAEKRTRILPLKGLVQLLRAAEPDEHDLTIDLRENQVTFALAHTEIIAQLVEGEFPDFRAVIPADHPFEAVIGREEFASAVRRASVTAGDEARSVELKFTPGHLTVASRQEGLGESTSELAIDYEGDEIEMRFNPDFLGEYLRAAVQPRVVLHFKDRASAGLFVGRDAPSDEAARVSDADDAAAEAGDDAPAPPDDDAAEGADLEPDARIETRYVVMPITS